MTTAKDEVRRLLEAPPEDAGFEDVQYLIYVRERIERGQKEADESKVIAQYQVLILRDDRYAPIGRSLP